MVSISIVEPNVFQTKEVSDKKLSYDFDANEITIVYL